MEPGSFSPRPFLLISAFASSAWSTTTWRKSFRPPEVRMTLELTVGMQIFHNGIPIQLLYRINNHTWRVKMLFVIAEDRDEHFGPYDTVSLLHTSHEKTSSYKTAA